MPQISVIVPVYNVEVYLGDCLDSILNQTYRDFELILVDDGSTDNSGRICDEYKERESRIRVFHKENGGQSSARNLGIEKSNCEWLCFIDSDDIVHPCLLEYLKKGVDENGTLMSTCLYMKGECLPADFVTQKEYHPTIIEVNDMALSGDGILSYSGDNAILWIVCCKLVHQSLLHKYPMSNGRIYEDNAVAIKWVHEAGIITVINEILYFYRQNPDSTMHKPLTHKSADYLWALEEQLGFAQSIGYQNLLTLIYENYLGTALHLFKRFVRENNDNEFARDILTDANRIRDSYSLSCENERIVKYQRDIVEILHPFRKYMRKKIERIKALLRLS